MKILAADVVVTSPDRSLVTLRMTTEDGHLHPGDEPGLGVSLDGAAAARFPYQPAYLPLARLRDGTVHDW